MNKFFIGIVSFALGCVAGYFGCTFLTKKKIQDELDKYSEEFDKELEEYKKEYNKDHKNEDNMPDFKEVSDEEKPKITETDVRFCEDKESASVDGLKEGFKAAETMQKHLTEYNKIAKKYDERPKGEKIIMRGAFKITSDEFINNPKGYKQYTIGYDEMENSFYFDDSGNMIENVKEYFDEELVFDLKDHVINDVYIENPDRKEQYEVILADPTD